MAFFGYELLNACVATNFGFDLNRMSNIELHLMMIVHCDGSERVSATNVNNLLTHASRTHSLQFSYVAVNECGA